MRRLHSFYLKSALLIIVLVPLIAQEECHAQVRSGIGFLKMNPGARQHGIAGSLTGNLDHIESFYVNPGATGLLRQWQWSLSYTNWISDLQNASFLYGRNIRTPWSRFTRFVVGANYLGIPDFDSSEGAAPAVSGNDLLLTASIGQPIGAAANNLALGVNFKYLRSELAEFNADAFMFDVGMLYRTPRFDFISPGSGFLDFAILSAGVSLTNIGSSVTFLDEATPLPRTLRGGLAFIAGSHDGLQISVAGDYRAARDNDGYFSIGSELSWQQLLSLRWGYNFEDNLLGQFTFGASFSLDDQQTPIGNRLPGTNNALRFDLAANQNSDFSSSPFHGSVSHYPIAPESFRLIEPQSNTEIEGDSVNLVWEFSRDPDLFDKVDYWILVDRDSARLMRVVDNTKAHGKDWGEFLKKESLLVNSALSETNYLMTDLQAGVYFWSVFAYDGDQHVRFAKPGKDEISRFNVRAPQLEITSIDFDYSPWITEDDYQGILRVTVVNNGKRAARNVSVSVRDSLDFVENQEAYEQTPHSNLVLEETLSEMLPQTSKILEAEWRTSVTGLHHLTADLTRLNPKTGEKELIHHTSADFYTIPKGNFVTGDSATVLQFLNITYEMPFLNLVFFDSSSSEVKAKFIREWVVEPPLITLSKRLKAHPDIKIALQGTADPNSGETDASLGEARAHAVRDSLQSLGVSQGQMDVLPGLVLPVRSIPNDRQDGLWISQERRRVTVTTEQGAEEMLFAPFDHFFNERTEYPVSFSANIAGSVPLKTRDILFQAERLDDTLSIGEDNELELKGEFDWLPKAVSQAGEDEPVREELAYSLVLTDSLNRIFKTQPKQLFLNTRIINRERMYFGIAKFALAEPYYDFYWGSLMSRISLLMEKSNERMRFIGHACAIGSEWINMDLSQRRARLFHEKFLRHVKEHFPDSYKQILNRLDPPQMFGEARPFVFKGRKGKETLLGDNMKPLGRQMNRRVIALFYSEE